MCEWLACGTYGTGGARGKQCLASREVDPSARTSALGFLAGAKKYAGPLPAGPPSPHQHPAVTLERAGPITCTHFRAARCAPSGLHAAPPFRVEPARPEARFSGSARDATHERQVTS